MKKWVVYVLGVITGFVLAIIVGFVVNSSQSKESNSNVIGTETTTTTEEESDDGVKMFDEPGEIINEKSYQVFQVIAENAALVRGKDKGHRLYTGPIYLLINHDGKYYYDEEKVDVPQGKVVRQVGIYQYETRNEFLKTVPIIMIMNK